MTRVSRRTTNTATHTGTGIAIRSIGMGTSTRLVYGAGLVLTPGTEAPQLRTHGKSRGFQPDRGASNSDCHALRRSVVWRTRDRPHRPPLSLGGRHRGSGDPLRSRWYRDILSRLGRRAAIARVRTMRCGLRHSLVCAGAGSSADVQAQRASPLAFGLLEASTGHTSLAGLGSDGRRVHAADSSESRAGRTDLHQEVDRVSPLLLVAPVVREGLPAVAVLLAVRARSGVGRRMVGLPSAGASSRASRRAGGPPPCQGARRSVRRSVRRWACNRRRRGSRR